MILFKDLHPLNMLSAVCAAGSGDSGILPGKYKEKAICEQFVSVWAHHHPRHEVSNMALQQILWSVYPPTDSVSHLVPTLPSAALVVNLLWTSWKPTTRGWTASPAQNSQLKPIMAQCSWMVWCTSSVECFNTTCTFNPLDGTWNEAAPMHSRRGYVSVVVLDGYIYAMGGFEGTQILNTAECYEPSSKLHPIHAPEPKWCQHCHLKWQGKHSILTQTRKHGELWSEVRVRLDTAPWSKEG